MDDSSIVKVIVVTEEEPRQTIGLLLDPEVKAEWDFERELFEKGAIFTVIDLEALNVKDKGEDKEVRS